MTCKNWKYVSHKRNEIVWACTKCGAQIAVNTLNDSITNHLKCEACGHEKYKETRKNDALLKSLYGEG